MLFSMGILILIGIQAVWSDTLEERIKKLEKENKTNDK